MTFPFRSSGGPRRLLCAAGISVTVVATSFFVATPAAMAAQAPVGLGTADSFAVLAGSGITNTGPTTITGDVGTFPTPSQTGFGSVTLTGTNHAGDAVTQGAKDDLVTAYNDAGGRTPVTNLPVELGGTVLPAGVYTSPTFGLTGTLTLDAQGDPDAQFIFLAGSTLITATDSRVLLLNGANPCRVVWQVGSSATFDTRTQFVGDVLALESISALTSATFQGRLLARNGAVTLDTNTITNAACSAPSGGGVAPVSADGVTPAGDGTTLAAIPTAPITTAEVSPPVVVASPTPPPALTGAPGSPPLAFTGPLTGRLIWTALGLLCLGALAVRSARPTGRGARR